MDDLSALVLLTDEDLFDLEVRGNPLDCAEQGPNLAALEDGTFDMLHDCE